MPNRSWKHQESPRDVDVGLSEMPHHPLTCISLLSLTGKNNVFFHLSMGFGVPPMGTVLHFHTKSRRVLGILSNWEAGFLGESGHILLMIWGIWRKPTIPNLHKLPSGTLKHSHGKWALIVSFPSQNGDFPFRYVKLPQGNTLCLWLLDVGKNTL